MANIFIKEPVYITIDELKDSTTKTDLATKTDDELKVLITKAQEVIDRYIKSYWTPYQKDQDYIFPIKDENENSYIPEDITIATLYTIEQLFVSWDLISWAVNTWWNIKSEKVWDRTITYTEATNNNLKFLWIPFEAEQILKKYRRVFYKSTI